MGILYGIILQVRNLLFDFGILTSIKPNKPSISLGNLTMGGTGKTPALKFLLAKLGSDKTAVISRGYGRKSKGFQTVEIGDNVSNTGDEPLEIKTQFPTAKVFVSEKRAKALEILKKEKGIDFFLFDDLFQHRSVRVDCSILLSTYKRPFYQDTVLPSGNLREFSFNKKRADILVITKCPSTLSEKEAKKIKNKANVNIPVFFSSQSYAKALWVLPKERERNQIKRVISISSIAHPEDFFQECGKQFEVTKTKAFPDHYNYAKKDIEELIGLANKSKSAILTTAKDLPKLLTFAPLFKELDLGVIPMKMEILFQEENAYLNCIKKIIQ